MKKSKVLTFEKDFGSIELLKAIITAQNRILISKGLITEKELQTTLQIELKSRRPRLERDANEQHI